MKKIITIALLLFTMSGFSKPIITYSYGGLGGLIKFLSGGTYSTVTNKTEWEWSGGTFVCTKCDVSCKGDGPEDCKAVYKVSINPNPFTEPEQNLIEKLMIYAKNSGLISGSHSETITIQEGNNCPETYVYTITWNEDISGIGNVTISNVLIN